MPDRIPNCQKTRTFIKVGVIKREHRSLKELELPRRVASSCYRTHLRSLQRKENSRKQFRKHLKLFEHNVSTKWSKLTQRDDPTVNLKLLNLHTSSLNYVKEIYGPGRTTTIIATGGAAHFCFSVSHRFFLLLVRCNLDMYMLSKGAL